VPCLRWLTAGCPLHWLQYYPGSGHVGFVVDKVALEHVISKYVGFTFHFSFHWMFCTRISSRTGITGPTVAGTPSGFSLTWCFLFKWRRRSREENIHGELKQCWNEMVQNVFICAAVKTKSKLQFGYRVQIADVQTHSHMRVCVFLLRKQHPHAKLKLLECISLQRASQPTRWHLLFLPSILHTQTIRISSIS
jgi:hypothetical protein